MARRPSSLMFILCLLLFATGIRWFAPADSREAKLTAPPAGLPGLRLVPRAGTVQVQLPSLRWASVTSEQDVPHGTRLRTMPGAAAALRIDEGSQVELHERTVAQVERYRNPEAGLECWLLLQSGELRLSQREAGQVRRFVVITPWAALAAEGEAIELLVALEAHETRVALSQGTLRVDTGQEEQVLRAPITFFVSDFGRLVLP